MTTRSGRTTRRGRVGATVVASMLALSLGGAVVSTPATVAFADERANLVKQREERQNQRADLGNQLTGISADLGEIYLRLADAEAKLPVAEAELAAAEARVTQISERLVQAEAESKLLGEQIAQGAKDIDATRSSLGRLARDAYRSGGVPSTMSLVTGASTSRDFVDQALVTSTAARSQQDVLTTLESDVALNRNKEARQQALSERVTQLRDDAVAAKESAQVKRDEVVRLKKETEDRKAELEGHRAEIDRQIAESEAATQRISAEISRIDEENRRQQLILEQQAAERARAQQEALARARAQAAPGSPAPVVSAGRFLPPTNACVNSEWGMRMHPVLGYARMHEGLDQRVGTGVPQVAMTDGIVVSAYADVTGGNMVVINHGLIDGRSVVTKHLHLSQISVSPGQRVARGEVIGLTGATGRVTGAHVHHEVWVNGSSVNPRTFYGDAVRTC